MAAAAVEVRQMPQGLTTPDRHHLHLIYLSPHVATICNAVAFFLCVRGYPASLDIHHESVWHRILTRPIGPPDSH